MIQLDRIRNIDDVAIFEVFDGFVGLYSKTHMRKFDFRTSKLSLMTYAKGIDKF